MPVRGQWDSRAEGCWDSTLEAGRCRARLELTTDRPSAVLRSPGSWEIGTRCALVTKWLPWVFLRTRNSAQRSWRVGWPLRTRPMPRCMSVCSAAWQAAGMRERTCSTFAHELGWAKCLPITILIQTDGPWYLDAPYSATGRLFSAAFGISHHGCRRASRLESEAINPTRRPSRGLLPGTGTCGRHMTFLIGL